MIGHSLIIKTFDLIIKTPKLRLAVFVTLLEDLVEEAIKSNGLGLSGYFTPLVIGNSTRFFSSTSLCYTSSLF